MADRNYSTIASPLYCEGVHHAEVTSPMWATEIPDPLGFLGSSPPEAAIQSRGGGDGVNDWHEEFPDDDGKGY